MKKLDTTPDAQGITDLQSCAQTAAAADTLERYNQIENELRETLEKYRKEIFEEQNNIYAQQQKKIKDLIDKKIKPVPYDRKKWDNPIDYLKKEYGDYIARFNDSGIDFLYMDQLGVIDKKFKRTLQTYLIRHKLNIRDYIKPKTERVQKELKNLSRYKKLRKAILAELDTLAPTCPHPQN